MFPLWNERPPTSVGSAQNVQLSRFCAPVAPGADIFGRERDERRRQSPNLTGGKADRKTRARTFQDGQGGRSRTQGRRSAAKGALYFAGCRQPGLDARRDLSRGGRGQHGDGRRRHRRSGVVESTGAFAGRHRVRRYRLAGLCGGSSQASQQDAEDRADDASAQRLRHRRAHRLFRAARRRQAEGRRDRGGLGRRRIGRIDRRADREDKRMPRDRHRRRQGQMRLADIGTRLRCRGGLQGRRGVSGVAGRGAEGHRRLFRQCRRRHSRSLPRADEQSRPHRLLRRDLAI